MKRSVSSAPRPDATGAPSAPSHSSVVLTNASTANNQQTSSPIVTSVNAATASNVTAAYAAGLLPHGTQIHSSTSSTTATLHPHTQVVTGGGATPQTAGVVHISSANLNQIIRPLSTGSTSAANNPTAIHTISSNVGINLSALGTPVSGQITIPASAVSAAAAAAHTGGVQTGPTNLILHRQSSQQQQTGHSNISTNTVVSGSGASSGTGSSHRYIPTTLHLNKVAGNISGVNQITVSQATPAQIQISGGSTPAVATQQNQVVPLGQQHSAATGGVAIATQLVTSSSASAVVHPPTATQQVVYPRVQTQRIITTTQPAGVQNLQNYNSGPNSIGKLTNSSSGNSTAESMQSLAQFQSAAVAYTTGASGPGGSSGGRVSNVPVSSTQPQIYSTNTKNNAVIQVRQKVQMTSLTQQQIVSSAGTQINTNSRRLKVEDALSYLDKVKYKFGDQPQVYNDFLDIMKEFKSESIDTPGVITRVSNLFNGHPELIEGFNTFLPPGYKIEVKPSEGNAYQVSVSIPSPTQSTATVVHTQQGLAKGLASPPMSGTPVQNASVHAQSGSGKQTGQLMQIVPGSTIIHTTMPSSNITVSQQSSSGVTTVQNVAAAAGGGAIAVTTPSIPPSHQTVSASLPQTSPGHLSSSTSINLHSQSGSGNGGAAGNYQTNVNSSVTSNVSHSNNNSHHLTQTQAVCQVLSQVDTSHANPQNQRVEFNHAINYVNKIKNRFQSQPERYKKFLEILHTYQKEQRIMKESNLNSSAACSGNLSHNDSINSLGSGNVAGSGSVGGKHLTEAEVYSQVAKLFENQEDLLAEFGQFLPDATSSSANKNLSNDSHITKKPIVKTSYSNSIRDRERERERENRDRDHRDREHRDRNEHHRNESSVLERDRSGSVSGTSIGAGGALGGNSGGIGTGGINEHRDRSEHRSDRNSLSSSQKYGHTSGQIKRSPPYVPQALAHRDGPPMKKHKVPCLRDVSLAEAGKYGTLHDYAFFDKVRKALRSQEVYDNFLRCLVLYNEEVISRSELVQLSGPFLGKFPELFKWFKDFIGHSDSGVEPIPNNVARQERPQGDNAMEVDLTTCKRLGASYCALPKSHTDATYAPLSSVLPPGAQGHVGSLQGSRRCSGRTQLCREVLNDTWVSFPTWSEDSTFVTNRKTQFEEYIYRCEDERFELDVVIETNASTIRVLEGVWRRIQRFTPDELARFRLDDTLGGTSAVLHQRALRRIYGDKAADIVDGLKRNPGVAVQVVLRRLRAKEEEWREAQKSFNKIWREQNEKYYLKSLDHQGINFKQNDVKSLRSKSLFNEIETLYDERHEQHEEGATSAAIGSAPLNGPHLVLSYAAHITSNSSVPANPVISGANLTNGNIPRTGPIERSVLDDAAGLLIHHVRRQTGIQKQEKARIKALLRQFIPDLFHHPRQQLSDDERDDEDDREDMEVEANSRSSPNNISDNKSNSKSSNTSRKTPPNETVVEDNKSNTQSSGDVEIKKEIDIDNIKQEDECSGNIFEDDSDEYYTLFMANNHWYLFLRLHAVLCSRLATMHAHAQRLLAQEREERSKRKQSTAVALKLKPQPEYEVEQYYPAFLDMVKNVLDGNMDSNAYEDTLREMFGIHAYIAFTLDKVVSYAVRQLQHCATERGAIECCNMFLNERRKLYSNNNNNSSSGNSNSGGSGGNGGNNNNSNRRESLRDKDFFRNLSKDVYSLLRTNNLRGGNDSLANTSGAGGACATAHRRKTAEIAYQRAAEAKLRDENCFKIYIYKNNLRVTIELLDSDSDEQDSQNALSEAAKRSNFIERFANDSIAGSGGSDVKTNRLTSTSGFNSAGGDNAGSTASGNNNHDNKSTTGTSDTKNNVGGVNSANSNNNSGGNNCEKGTRKRFERSSRESTSTEIKEEKHSDQEESEHGNESTFRSWSGRKATFLKRNLRDFRQRAQRNNLLSAKANVAISGTSEATTSSKTSESCDTAEISTSNTDEISGNNNSESTVQRSDDVDLKDSEMKEIERKLVDKRLPQRITDGATNKSEFVVNDQTQCRFNLQSYKMVYIVNRESYMYKKDAFTKARQCHPQVTKHLSARFRLWHKRWLSANVTETQQKATCDWLMGRTEGLCPNRTRVITNNDIRRTPYTTYNRYRVERFSSSSVAITQSTVSDGESG